MRRLLYILVVLLLVGCTSAPKKGPSTFSDWNAPTHHIEQKQTVTEQETEPKAEPAKDTVAKAKNSVFVAIVETISDGVTQQNENQYLTNVLREEAIKELPSNLNYTIMTRENIQAMLPPDKAIEECEGSCLVETGRNIAANYIAQARISTFGDKITISVELYSSSTGRLVASFNAKQDDIESLETEIRAKAPAMFQEIMKLESSN